MNLFSLIAKIFVAIAVVALLAILGWNWHTARLETVRLRGDSTNAANTARDAQLRLSDKEKQEAEAKVKALQDEQDRRDRDNQTAALIGNLTRPQQNDAALQYLIAGGFLNRKDYEGRPVQVSSDSNVTRAVATQGKVLIDTRTQLTETNQALRQTMQQVSDLEIISNGVDVGITNIRGQVQDYAIERGLLRGHSRKQFRSVDRSLSDLQKQMHKPLTKTDTLPKP